MSDGDRLVEQRLRTGKPHRQVGTILLHLLEELIPPITKRCQIPLLHHPAQVRNAALNRLDSTIASRIKHQLRGARQLRGLPRSQAKIHFEGYPSLRVLRTRITAQILLSCGEKCRCSFKCGAVIERSPPHAACGTTQRLHTATLLYADSRGHSFSDERRIKRLPRQRGCGKRQRSLRSAPRSGQPNVVDRHGAK